MGLLNWLKSKSNKKDLNTELQQADLNTELQQADLNTELQQADLNTELQQALSLSREGKHTEAYPIYEGLYNKKRNATNAFNLFTSAVYCGKTEVENELYEKLKCYSPNPRQERIKRTRSKA